MGLLIRPCEVLGRQKRGGKSGEEEGRRKARRPSNTHRPVGSNVV